MWKIKKSLIDDLFETSMNNYPKEFMSFLGIDKNIISEIIVLPNTSGSNFASINLNVVPINTGIVGSFHSHPTGMAFPSKADKKFFQRYKINLILSLSNNKLKAYDSNGEEVEYEIVR